MWLLVLCHHEAGAEETSSSGRASHPMRRHHGFQFSTLVCFVAQATQSHAGQWPSKKETFLRFPTEHVCEPKFGHKWFLQAAIFTRKRDFERSRWFSDLVRDNPDWQFLETQRWDRNRACCGGARRTMDDHGSTGQCHRIVFNTWPVWPFSIKFCSA